MADIRKKIRRGGGTKKPVATTETQKALKHFMTHKHGDYLNVPINQLKPNPDQPRKEFDKNKLQELSCSIKDNGVLQPLLIRVINNQLWIVAGERRYRAATMAKLKTVPCIVTTGDPDEISLIENIQREDLTPVELSDGIDKMMQKHNYNQSQVAKIIGKSRSTISAILAIKRLPDSVREDLSRTRNKGDGIIPISRRTLVEIAREPPEKAKKLYDVAKKGATSEEIRAKRRTQVTNKNSADKIFSQKIHAVMKVLDNIDSIKRLNHPIIKDLKSLHDKLSSLLKESTTKY